MLIVILDSEVHKVHAEIHAAHFPAVPVQLRDTQLVTEEQLVQLTTPELDCGLCPVFPEHGCLYLHLQLATVHAPFEVDVAVYVDGDVPARLTLGVADLTPCLAPASWRGPGESERHQATLGRCQASGQ